MNSLKNPLVNLSGKKGLFVLTRKILIISYPVDKWNFDCFHEGCMFLLCVHLCLLIYFWFCQKFQYPNVLFIRGLRLNCRSPPYFSHLVSPALSLLHLVPYSQSLTLSPTTLSQQKTQVKTYNQKYVPVPLSGTEIYMYITPYTTYIS